MANAGLRIELPVELFEPAASQHYEGVYEMDVLKSGVDLYTFEQAPRWSIDISNTGEALLVLGVVEAVGKTSCARCLDDAYVDFYSEIEGYFLFEEPSEEESEDEDFDYDILPEDKIIDMGPMIESAMRLDVPFMPLCDDDCKGICAGCGANLNQEPCRCEPEQPVASTNPFAVLKDYSFNDEEQ